MNAEIIVGVVIILAAVAFVAYAVRESIKYRARVPELVRAAVALTEEQVAELSDDQLGTYRYALEYARRYKRGALRGDLELAAAVAFIEDEQIRRIERDDAIRLAEDIARAAAKTAEKATQARRDLGL